jgi:hypothetical protein
MAHAAFLNGGSEVAYMRSTVVAIVAIVVVAVAFAAQCLDESALLHCIS